MIPLSSHDLEAVIRERIAGRVKDLKVSLCGDRVILEGSSQTFYAKQLAQHAAQQFAPQGHLLNEIIVRRMSPAF